MEIDLSKILFAVEPLINIKTEIPELYKLHYEEIEWIKSAPVEPDWIKYEIIENNGSLVIFTAREETKLIGYNVFFLSNDLHYSGVKSATQDVLFINPIYRGFGKGFISWCDMQLKQLEVNRVYYHLKLSNNFGPKILEPLGYMPIDIVYGKEIDYV